MRRAQVAGAVRRLLGDPADVADRLHDAFAESPESLPGAGADETAADERARIVGDGLEGLAKLAEGREEEIDDDEVLGLEAIVLIEGRPALLVRDGDFEPPPHGWERLLRHRGRIREVIARAGRIEVTGNLDHSWAGTGSLVAPGVVLTNRHVALTFCARAGDGWSFAPAMTADGASMSSRIDFCRELGSPAAADFEITGVIGIHERHDLALLRVEEAAPDGRRLPDPLPVAAAEPSQLFGRDVYVVGHPAHDGGRGEPEPLRRIFRDVYEVKRLQPGQSIGYSAKYSALQHDCSTLGGNSGSPVVDLETHQVVGLHFSGRYGTANYAVPLWLLRGDALLTRGAVNFQ